MQCSTVCNLLVDLCEDLRVLEEVVLFVSDLDRRAAPSREEDAVTGLDGNGGDLTVLLSAQSLRARPTLPGAPGPTAITVASGRGFEVADEGRKIPVAVLVSALKR